MQSPSFIASASIQNGEAKEYPTAREISSAARALRIERRLLANLPALSNGLKRYIELTVSRRELVFPLFKGSIPTTIEILNAIVDRDQTKLNGFTFSL